MFSQRVLANSLQRSFVSVRKQSPDKYSVFLYLYVRNVKQGTESASVDVYLNKTPVYRELPTKKELKCGEERVSLKLDILQPFICNFRSGWCHSDNISKASSILYIQKRPKDYLRISLLLFMK
jgi:hypothetical protein